MNNQMPYFNNNQFPINNQIPYLGNNQNPINNPNQISHIEYEKLINKITRLEKNIRILENRINKLEENNNNLQYDDPTDMYII